MNGHVTVSMYNVGFGDSFLLTFPGVDRDRRVLIDCGSIKQPTVNGAEVPIDTVVDKIIDDVTGPDGPHIDVVAISHRHHDHVSGFSRPAWEHVRVEEVWLPWTEDPSDPVARRLLESMSSFALTLERERLELQRLRALTDADDEFISHVVENLLGGRQADGTLSLRNEEAMATLHRGFLGGTRGARRRFLRRQGARTRFAADDVLPGTDVFVLGPSDDEAVIRNMEPPRPETFHHATPDAGVGTSTLLLPFDRWEWVSPEDLEPALIALLQSVTRKTALVTAAALESAVNNTSLMLAFVMGAATLFFPGDSQWGSWEINLEDSECMDLLRRTTFYKVGHHGSHNSNPRSFVDDRALALWGAATSVARHGSFDRIPEIPMLRALEDRFADVVRSVRSDQLPARMDGVTVSDDGLRIDFEVPI